jgi:hypothetical protein
LTLTNISTVALAASLALGATAQTRSAVPEPQNQNIVTAEAPQATRAE